MRAPALRTIASALLLTLAACGAVPSAPAGVPTLTLGPPPTRTPGPGTPTVAAASPALASASPVASSAPGIPVDAQGFADPAFHALWDATDKAVAEGRASHSWLWGPPLSYVVRYEPYAQSPGGRRLVQYFDKSRMEINDPNGDRASPWFVTNGLLTSEMVAGRVQVGQDAFEALEPATAPVTGDLEGPDPQTPRYADFGGAVAARAPKQLGAPVATRLRRGGATEPEGKPPAPVKLGRYDETTGHNVPDVFATYLDGLSGLGVSWVFITGYPISEPYWVVARFGGQPQVVLVQLFERRVLTYAPSGKGSWQVEFANIGLHYYRWRYLDR